MCSTYRQVTRQVIAGTRQSNLNTDVVEKYYVRVDLTEKYPYLDKKLSPFYDRD